MFKDINFDHHISEVFEDNVNCKTIKEGDKDIKENISMDIDALELSVDIFDEPNHSKNEELDIVENPTLNQVTIDSTNIVLHQCGEDALKHVDPVFDNPHFSKKPSNSKNLLQKCFFEYTNIDDMEVFSKNKNNWKNSNDIVKPYTSSLVSTKLRLITKKSALNSYEGYPLIATSCQEDDNDRAHIRNDQNVENNMQTLLKDGEIIIGQTRKNEENSKQEDNKYEKSKRKKIISRTKMKVTLNTNENVDTIKDKRPFILNDANVKRTINKEKTIMTRVSAINNPNRLKKDFKNIVKSRTTQQEKNAENKAFNMAIQHLENHDGM